MFSNDAKKKFAFAGMIIGALIIGSGGAIAGLSKNDSQLNAGIFLTVLGFCVLGACASAYGYLKGRRNVRVFSVYIENNELSDVDDDNFEGTELTNQN